MIVAWAVILLLYVRACWLVDFWCRHAPSFMLVNARELSKKKTKRVFAPDEYAQIAVRFRGKFL